MVAKSPFRKVIAMATWPADSELSPNAREQIFALGVTVFRFNMLEAALYTKFSIYLDRGPEVAARTLSYMSADKQIDLFQTVIEKSPFEHEIKENDDWFLKGYKRCQQNRNLLCHSEVLEIAPNMFDLQGMSFAKRRKDAPHQHNAWIWNLAQIQEAADGIEQFRDFGNQTTLCVLDRLPRLAVNVGITSSLSFGPAEHVPLPDKPPLPALLPV